MYDDIIDVCYPFDLGRSRMSLYDRSSQFMPFSALNGYKEAVLETSRITDNKIILDDEAKEILDNKIGFINSLSLKPNVTITYFIPDDKKNGGSYKSVSGCIKKVDLFNNIVIIGGKKINIGDILDIDSEVFCNMEK